VKRSCTQRSFLCPVINEKKWNVVDMERGGKTFSKSSVTISSRSTIELQQTILVRVCVGRCFAQHQQRTKNDSDNYVRGTGVHLSHRVRVGSQSTLRSMFAN
jgi:hypothetical protein